MARVTGLGGLFFKADDPEKLYQWYEKHLGVKRDVSQAVTFTDGGMTVWSIFPKSTKYFGRGPAGFMMNFRVGDLDALLEQLKQAGVEIDPQRQDYDYGPLPGSWIRKAIASSCGSRPRINHRKARPFALQAPRKAQGRNMRS
jgi:hypothetical protein